MKRQYIQPTVTVSDMASGVHFLTGSDPTINTEETSDDMDVKEYTNNFGDLW